MLSLYDSKTFKQIKVARTLQTETHRALIAIFRKYIDLDYSPREISHVMQGEIRSIELIDVLSNTKKRLSE